MKITIKDKGYKVKLDEDASKMLMDAIFQFASEKWNLNSNENDELRRQVGLIQWIGNVFED